MRSPAAVADATVWPDGKANPETWTAQSDTGGRGRPAVVATPNRSVWTTSRKAIAWAAMSAFPRTPVPAIIPAAAARA
ncbi:MAG: hypothetical protein ACRDOO_22530 [Actinomadura sp.]